jgi:hypothetical protein
MNIVVTQKGTKWYAQVIEYGSVVVESHTGEPRVGCAIRQVLNKLQITYGLPSTTQVNLTIDGW